MSRPVHLVVGFAASAGDRPGTVSAWEGRTLVRRWVVPPNTTYMDSVHPPLEFKRRPRLTTRNGASARVFYADGSWDAYIREGLLP